MEAWHIDPSALGVTTTELTHGVNSFCTSVMIPKSVNLSSSLLYAGCRHLSWWVLYWRDALISFYVVRLCGEQTNSCQYIVLFFE